MEGVAQGRVWAGKDALERGLVDAVGGLSRAVAIAKQKANIPQDKQVWWLIVLFHDAIELCSALQYTQMSLSCKSAEYGF